MISENAIKKEFLKRYQISKKIQESIWDEIRELRAGTMMPAVNMDGMPHGTGKTDLSSYAVQKEKLDKKLGKEVDHQIRIRKQIWKVIEELPTEAEKMILKFRYINGWEWEKVAVHSCYTYRHTLRIHGEALKHLQIPEWYVRQFQQKMSGYVT